MFVIGKDEFLKVAKKGKVIPLIYQQPLSQESPFSTLLKLGPQEDCCLLESAGGAPHLAKYSFICFSPLARIRSKEGSIFVEEGKKFHFLRGNPFLILRDLCTRYAPEGEIKLPFPFWGGAVGYLGYDAARYIESLPKIAPDDLGLPDCYFIFPQIVLVFDHEKNFLYIVANKLIQKSAKESYNQANRVINWVLKKLNSSKLCLSFTEGEEIFSSNTSRLEFMEMVKKIKEYIRAGDVYQVNISQRLQSSFKGNPLSLYERLREVNPSPFAAYLDFKGFQLVCSSPERLIKLNQGMAQTRPIAGTRRRGETKGEDKELSGDLLLDPKERAEHIMLVDLERNDLGRVCEYGTVKVDELMVIEKYSHVIHIVSNVQGKLNPGKDQFDLIQAMFPGGTITGCPKIRSMEIIEELEPVQRGPYTGSIGYFGYNGHMDMNIIIRTFVIKDQKAYVQVGSGIVADSQPKREYFESLSKAQALLSSLGITMEGIKWEKLPT